MKFISIAPEEKTTRITTGFALFPVTLDFGNRRETRWLEFYKIKEMYCSGKWRAVCFVDDKGE